MVKSQIMPVSMSMAHVTTKGHVVVRLLPRSVLISKGCTEVALPLTDRISRESKTLPMHHSRLSLVAGV